MTDSLRIVTYNTQLRSWGMDVGIPPSIPPVHTAEERARNIGINLLSSQYDYDIICLNEVFDEDARDILSNGLRAKYPFQVIKADLLRSTIVRPDLRSDIDQKVFDLTFGPLLDIQTLLSLKLEDSGLFLCSRWPFATVPVSDEVRAFLALLGGPAADILFPTGVPIIRFLPFPDAAGADFFAAKGVLYARIQRDPQQIYHVFMSHTQADEKRPEEHREERDKQISLIFDFITKCVGRKPPFKEEIFFLGDLNIVGGSASITGIVHAGNEWKDIFNTPGRPFTDHLVDVWGTRQCRGDENKCENGDRGYTANVSYNPIRQRLDYLVVSSNSMLAVQHLRIDKDLATAAPMPGVPSLSDHLPLCADLNRIQSYNSPSSAFPVNDPCVHDDLTPPRSFDPDFDSVRILGPDEVMWYRYNKSGTYEFQLVRGADQAKFEVFWDTDLSRPRDPYRDEESPKLGKRFVVVAPFLVKISGINSRYKELSFQFSSHRHVGRGPEDAIYLIPTIPCKESFPVGEKLNGDETLTEWDDTDTKWFLLDTPTNVSLIRPTKLKAVVEIDRGPNVLSLLVAGWDGANLIDFVDQTSGPGSTLTLEWQARSNERFFVCVQRRDPTFPDIEFKLTAYTDVTYLRGGIDGHPSLICTKETSGWGADDIELKISVDGNILRYINNVEIGDFEQDSVRDLWQWIPRKVAYQEGIDVTVIEVDDIDSNDVGSTRILPLEDIQDGDPFYFIDSDRTNRAKFIDVGVRIRVDDGTYTFVCSLAPWDENR